MPDGIIDLAKEMIEEREQGKLVTVAVALVYADGSSTWSLRGEQRPRPLIYEIELLKRAILESEE